MITAWTKHLKSEDERKKLESSIRHQAWLLEHLTQILTEIEASVEKQEMSPEVYKDPSWAYRQAHANGFKQCLTKIKKLIDLDQQG